MEKVKHILVVLMLMVVAQNAISAAMQQPVDMALASTPSVNTFDKGNNGNASNELLNTSTKVIVRDTSFNMIDTRYTAALDRVKQQAEYIKTYAKDNHYNTNYCFLVDMSIPSGKNRFFVYNLKTDKIESASLVAHGFGSTRKDGTDELDFSNNAFSFKTALGKYKIGYSYKGEFGLAYKLYGLDSTNSKAFQRAIVLHSDIHMPEIETYPYRIFQSAGCPTVSPGFLPVLSKFINTSKQPIIMWIYY